MPLRRSVREEPQELVSTVVELWVDERKGKRVSMPRTSSGLLIKRRSFADLEPATWLEICCNLSAAVEYLGQHVMVMIAYRRKQRG